MREDPFLPHTPRIRVCVGVSSHSFSDRTELGLAGTGGGVVYLYSNKKSIPRTLGIIHTHLRANVVSQDDGSEMTKEIYELVMLSTMIVDRIVGPQERKKRAVKPQSLPERSEKTAGCAGCHCEKRKNPPSPPCVEPPSPALGCVIKCFSPLDVYAHYERSPAPPPCLILTSLAIVPSAWTIRRPPASSCCGRERRRN